MANHKSALKRIRQSQKRNERNHYQHKSTRTMIKSVRQAENKEGAQKLTGTTISMIDKLAKKGIIHKNKAANLKSSIARQINAMK